MEKVIEKNLSGTKAGFASRFCDILRTYNGLFELFNVLFLVCIIWLFMPMVSMYCDKEGMKVFLTVLGSVGAIILCFSAIPCFFLRAEPRFEDELDEGEETEEDEDEETTEEADENEGNAVLSNTFYEVFDLITLVTYAVLVFSSIHHLFDWKAVYMYIVLGCLFISIYGCFKIVKQIVS